MDAYCGLPRAGKSYGVVKHVIVPAVREGREVWTNIPLHLEVWRERFPFCNIRQFTADEVIADPDWFDAVLPHGCVFVLDEVWRVWPSGVKANQLPEVHKKFLAMHGHRTDDVGRVQQVILVTQDLSQISAFVRQLVSKTFRVVKLDMIGKDQSYQVNVYQGPVTGDRPPKDKKISQYRGRIDPEIYALYRSHTESDAAAEFAPDESRLDDRASIWSQPWLRYLPGVLAIGVFLVWFTLSRLSGDAKSEPVPAPVVQRVPADQFPALSSPPVAVASAPAAAPVPAPMPIVSPAVAAPVSESSRWRVAGWVEASGSAQSLVVLTDGTYTRMRALVDGQCSRDDFGEVSCLLSGERVTQYSGRTTSPAVPVADPLASDTMLAGVGSSLLKNLGFKPQQEPQGKP